MIFACIYECTMLLIYLFGDSCKNYLPYIPIPRKSVVRTMFPIYPDDFTKLSFQVLLRAIFLNNFKAYLCPWFTYQLPLSTN